MIIMDTDIQNNQNQEPLSSNLAWSLVVILFILLLLAIGIIIYLLEQQKIESHSNPSLNEAEITTTGIPSPVITDSPAPITKPINKKYSFPFTNAQGEPIGQLEFLLRDFERSREIMIAGTKATALPGRQLLIFNLELTNNFQQNVEINTRNYLRLKANQEDKWLAPDYHNDPLEVQAQSTKITRIGFNISETDTNLVLQIGDLEGEKEILPLD